MSGANAYSGLEVAPKQYTYQPAGLEYDHYQNEQNAYKHEAEAAEAAALAAARPEKKRICGLSPKAFWITLVVVVIVVIAGAVGGGVGGSLAAKNNKKDENTTSEAQGTAAIQGTSSTSSTTDDATTSLTPSTTTAPALSTTTIIGPKYTLQRDCPSSNNTLYSVGDTSNQQWRKTCGTTLLNTLGTNIVNTRVASLNNCINLCAAYNIQNATQISKGENPVCNAVCWRNSLGDDEFPGLCFAFQTTNSSGEFVFTKGRETICDSAALINQKLI